MAVTAHPEELDRMDIWTWELLLAGANNTHILAHLPLLFTANGRPFTHACGSDSRDLNLGRESKDMRYYHGAFFWVAHSDTILLGGAVGTTELRMSGPRKL